MADEKYLAVKNWEKFQPTERLRKKDAKLPWVKSYTDKEYDLDYSNLSAFCRYLLDGVQRLRGRMGRNIDNDPSWLAFALQILPEERKCIPAALKKLIKVGMLIPCDGPHDTPMTPLCDPHDTPMRPPCDVLGQSNHKLNSRDREGDRDREGEVKSAQPIPISSRPEPVFTAIDAAKVLCDFEHLNLSGSHNLELAREVVGKAMLAWSVDALTAVDRIAENWRVYQAAKEPQKKQGAKWWLSDGSWNTVIVAAKPKPLGDYELLVCRRNNIETEGLTTEQVRAAIRGLKPQAVPNAVN